jgi:hypothetical protein
MRLEVTIMRLRMAKLSLEVSSGRAELAAEEALLELRMRGQKSQLRNLLTSFGDFARSWILSLWCAISQPYPSLSNGDSDLSRYPTLHPMEFLTLPVMKLSPTGEIMFCLEESEVSSALRAGGLVLWELRPLQSR